MSNLIFQAKKNNFYKRQANNLLKEINKRSQKSNLLIKIKKKPCPANWVDFARLLTVRSGAKFIKFDPYDAQIKLDRCFDTNHTTMGVKSRQVGWTTYAASKGLHKSIKNEAFTGIFISQKQSDACLIARNVREMMNSIEEYAEAASDNLLFLQIKDGGRIHFCCPGPDATRGIGSVSDIYIDEAAFISKIDQLYNQIKNTQSLTGDEARTLIISTPNTLTDWYFEKLKQGHPNILEIIEKVRKGELPPTQILKDPISGWAKFICHWKAHPIYSQIPNYLERCAERDQIPMEQVLRERDLSFLDNIQLVFSPALVKKACYLSEYTKKYEEDKIYLIGIDTASVGKNYFVAFVIEKESPDDEYYKPVEYYRSRTGTINNHLFELQKLIDKYNPYNIAIEVNGGGINYYELLNQEYPSQKFTKINTTEKSKEININKLLYCLQEGILGLVNDKIVINELLSFQKQGKKYEAIAGKDDDIVLALSFAASILPYWGKRPNWGN